MARPDPESPDNAGVDANQSTKYPGGGIDSSGPPRASKPTAMMTAAAAHGDDSEGALEMVGIDRNIRIGEEHLQAEPTFASIGQCFDERMSGREALALELPIDPVEEDLDLRLAVGESV